METGDKKNGIAPFEITHEANILRETSDGGFVTDEPVPISLSYTASFKTRGRVYSGTGATVSEAIGALAFRNGKGMGILTITRGNKSKTKVLTVPQVYRLFSATRLVRKVALKNVSALFEGV